VPYALRTDIYVLPPFTVVMIVPLAPTAKHCDTGEHDTSSKVIPVGLLCATQRA
jgi:hypothetical protein